MFVRKYGKKYRHNLLDWLFIFFGPSGLIRVGGAAGCGHPNILRAPFPNAWDKLTVNEGQGKVSSDS